MKKLSKALAMLLSFCVIFALVAVIASANATNQLDASQYGNNITSVLASDTGLSSGYAGGLSTLYRFQTVTEDGNTYTKLTRNTTTYPDYASLINAAAINGNKEIVNA